MSGQSLSAYCGLLNQYVELHSLGRYEEAEAMNEVMDKYWADMSEDEHKVAEKHAHQLAERYAS